MLRIVGSACVRWGRRVCVRLSALSIVFLHVLIKRDTKYGLLLLHVFCLLIMCVCSNNLSLCVSIMEVTSRAKHKAEHWEQRPLGLPAT